MARYEARVQSPWPADRTFDFMADLRNFERWDPGVKRAVQASGDGAGAEASFDVTVGGIGRDIVLRYRTLEFRHPERVVVEARNSILTSLDAIAVEPDGERSVVIYDATLALNGPLSVLDPLLRLAFRRIAGRATEGLRRYFAGQQV